MKVRRGEQKKMMQEHDHGGDAAQRFQLNEFATIGIHHRDAAEALIPLPAQEAKTKMPLVLLGPSSS
jgi:hypothetical protein